jgi:hypothetical protein
MIRVLRYEGKKVKGQKSNIRFLTFFQCRFGFLNKF